MWLACLSLKFIESKIWRERGSRAQIFVYGSRLGAVRAGTVNGHE